MPALAGTCQIQFSSGSGRLRSGAIWPVQIVDRYSGNGSNTVTVPLGRVEWGDELIVLVAPRQATTVTGITITGSLTTFTKVIGTANGTIPAEIWKGLNCQPADSATITVTFAATLTANAGVTVYEFGGLDWSGASILSRTGTGTSTSPSSGVLSTTVANNLAISLLNTAGTPTAGTSGWTAIFPNAAGNLVEFRINQTTGNPNATSTLSASAAWTQTFATFSAWTNKNLWGKCTIQFSQNAGVVSVTKPLAGTAQIQFSQNAGVVSVTKPLAGTCQIRFNAGSGFLRATKPLAGTAQIQFSSGTGQMTKHFGGVCQIQFSQGTGVVTVTTGGSGGGSGGGTGGGGTGATGAYTDVGDPSGAYGEAPTTAAVLLRGTCQIRFNQGRGTLTAGTPAGSDGAYHDFGDGTYTDIPSAMVPLAGVCQIRFNAGTGYVTSPKTLAGVCQIKFSKNTGRLSVTKFLAGTCQIKFSKGYGSLNLNKVLAGTAQIRFNRGSGALTVGALTPHLAGTCQIKFTSGKGVVSVRKLLAGTCQIKFTKGSGQMSPPVNLAGECQIQFQNSGDLTVGAIGALAGTCQIQFNRSSAILSVGAPRQLSGTCRIKFVRGSGLLWIIDLPGPATLPESGILPLPIMVDMEQMPIQQLTAYAAMYELPTENQQAADMLTNLKAIRWIMQGDLDMVLDSELTVLWLAYGLTGDAYLTDPDELAQGLMDYLSAMVSRHNAIGYCKSQTEVDCLGVEVGQTGEGFALSQISVDEEALV